MRDAMTSAAAVFEPEEVCVLAHATRQAIEKLAADGINDCEAQTEVARLVHNLGRSRIRLKKMMATPAHSVEIADEAVELFLYLEEAPETVLAAARGSHSSDASDRIVGPFPRAFRQPPVNRL